MRPICRRCQMAVVAQDHLTPMHIKSKLHKGCVAAAAILTIVILRYVVTFSVRANLDLIKQAVTKDMAMMFRQTDFAGFLSIN